MIRIDDPIHRHLAFKKPVYIIDGLHFDDHEVVERTAKRLGDSVVPLPPLNTHISFLKHLQVYSDQDHLDLHLRYSTSIISPPSKTGEIIVPEYYDWRFNHSSDDAVRRARKKNIAPPDNQHLCGSCWAISTAGVISDAFVVAGLVDFKPEISTTWALTCYPQMQCGGGNPSQLLKDIANGQGIPSKHCVDYSWCSKNSNCNGQGAKHFETAQNLSLLIPRECGCYSSSYHYVYTINNDVRLLAVDQGATSTINFRSSVQKHIFLHGPVLVGYFVMKNFSSGYFTRVNGGVYLERANYVPGSPLTFSDSEAGGVNYRGSHAVAIIGWGVAKNILYDNGKRGDVPYWYCRNSWGGKWGSDDGYFKMAMYPFNKISQFGKIVDIVDGQNQRHRCGGIITFTVSIPPKKTNKLKQLSNVPPSLLNPLSYYSTDEDVALRSVRSWSDRTIMYSVVVALAVAVAVMFALTRF